MIEITSGDLRNPDVLVVPVLEGRTPASDSPHSPDLGEFEEFFDVKDFSGRSDQVLFSQTPNGLAPETLFVGLGEDVDLESIRRAAGTVARAVDRYPTVATLLHDVGIDGADGAVVLGTMLGDYRFEEYLSVKKPSRFATLTLATDDVSSDSVDDAKAVARGVILARDLVNRPAADKPPAALADIASSLSAEVSVKVYDEQQIAEAGFGGLMAVNAGADQPARMVVMEYRPEGATRTVAFVGKGIVFDSGGLSIKSAAGMETMKTDMAGAAAVMGAVQAIAEMAIPVNVIAITPFTENLTGGSATRPGDVLRAYNGKTIEVLNTDAEGRLVLADGLSLAAERNPDLIVDIATLTGGCKVALGESIGGLFAIDDSAADLVTSASAAAGEKLWRLPMDPEYKPLIKSDIADMKNTAGRWASPITAALLLAEFVGDVPWVHLDVAGPARASKTEHYINKGASGFGVRTLVSVAEAMAAESG